MLTINDGAKHDWENMPLDEMAIGNAMDCDFTLRAYNILKGKLQEKNLQHVYNNLLKDITILLADMEYGGISVDVGYLDELELKLEEIVESEAKELIKMSGFDDVNPNSNADLAKVIFSVDGLGAAPQEFTAKSKAPSLTEAHLKKVLIDKKTPMAAKNFINKLLRYKSICKLHKTYVKGIKAATEYNGESRIHSNYNFGATVTGRLSCSMYSAGPKKKKGVSFHTLPRPGDDSANIRKLMIADEGKVFIAADFSQAELRMLAHCSNDINLINAFKSGQDLHQFTASLVLNKHITGVTRGASNCKILYFPYCIRRFRIKISGTN